MNTAIQLPLQNSDTGSPDSIKKIERNLKTPYMPFWRRNKKMMQQQLPTPSKRKCKQSILEPRVDKSERQRTCNRTRPALTARNISSFWWNCWKQMLASRTNERNTSNTAWKSRPNENIFTSWDGDRYKELDSVWRSRKLSAEHGTKQNKRPDNDEHDRKTVIETLDQPRRFTLEEKLTKTSKTGNTRRTKKLRRYRSLTHNHINCATRQPPTKTNVQERARDSETKMPHNSTRTVRRKITKSEI